MTLDWRPRKLAIDHLLACGIPKLFIEECIVSFAIYWNECGAMSNAWNAKFIDTKRQLHIDMTEVAIFGVRDDKFSSLREYYRNIKTPV